jgi:hypothetical protein
VYLTLPAFRLVDLCWFDRRNGKIVHVGPISIATELGRVAFAFRCAHAVGNEGP